MRRSRRTTRTTHRGSASAVAILGALLKIFLPLLVIAIAAYVVLNYSARGTGSVRVTTSVPGADILVGGMQTGFTTDTTIQVKAGRKIITVRKMGLVSDPEFAVIEVLSGGAKLVRFNLHEPEPVVPQDTIPPLRAVRQEVFSTGEPVHAIPPAILRPTRRLVDFSTSGISRERITRADAEWKPSGVKPVNQEDIGSLQGTQITVTSTPPNAEIWVNGALTTRATPYTFRGLDRGIYSFRARRDGFTAKPDSIVVALARDAQHELVAFELLPDLTLPKPKLVVTTSPLAAGIRVDSKPAGVGQVTMDVPYGQHRIDFAEVAGFRTPASVTTILTEDQPAATVVGEYVRLSGDGFIAVRPSDDLRKFDASLLRIYVDNELILDGADRPFDAALLGHLLSGKRLLRILYGDLSEDIHVNTLDGQVAEITFRVESFFSKRKLRLREKPVVPIEEWQQKSKKLDVLTVS
ncbi:hypothetical protein KKH27_06585 [bacterium]|nr:hypothetical protein [bacterium]MBU1984231.1 hypothetical protein [bacterium]